jgi:nucleoside-diphosphate-sugar epimerase
MNHKKVAIIGLGWLGMELALQLKNDGYSVFAGTRDKDKINKINELGLNGFNIIFDTNTCQILFNQISEIDYLIICLPPSGFDDYATSLYNIAVKFPECTNIIFTSSTGVYEDVNSEVDEESKKIEWHPVFLAEQKLSKLLGQRFTILRLAGLIGANRHPVKYFVQRNLIPNAISPINLVCRNDVIQAIKIVLFNGLFGEIYNIVNPKHISKKEYYLAAANELYGFEPQFDMGKKGKLVLGTKFEKAYQFNYEFDLDDWTQFSIAEELK